MSQAQRPGEVPAGRGVMRFLAGGRGSVRFGAVFQLVDALFSPSKSAAYVLREEQRRRKVAVPAPGDPPDDEHPHVDAAVAIPRDLLGPVEPVEPAADDARAPAEAPLLRDEPGAPSAEPPP